MLTKWDDERFREKGESLSSEVCACGGATSVTPANTK